MQQKSLYILTAIMLLVTTSPVCSFGAQKAVRLGYLQSDLHQLAAFIALEKGYFQEEGVPVIVGGIFKAGPEEMSAFAGGDLDVGYVGAAPAVVAAANLATDIKIIAQVNLEGSAIVVRKDSGISSLDDLKGKTVAVPGYAQVQDFLLRLALTQKNIPLSSIGSIIIKPPEMIPALETRQIDAFVAWEPYPAKAQTRGIGEILISSGDIWPQHPCCVVVASTEFIQANPDIIRGMLRAHVRATRFVQNNVRQAVAIGVKYTGMDEATIKLAMNTIQYEHTPAAENLRTYVTFLKENQVVSVPDAANFVNNLIDDMYLKQVLAD